LFFFLITIAEVAPGAIILFFEITVLRPGMAEGGARLQRPIDEVAATAGAHKVVDSLGVKIEEHFRAFLERYVLCLAFGRVCVCVETSQRKSAPKKKKVNRRETRDGSKGALARQIHFCPLVALSSLSQYLLLGPCLSPAL